MVCNVKSRRSLSPALFANLSGDERVDLQFRSEFFNLFNIVATGLPANIQFSLKLIY
jgi:hypothetical protein